jgi:cell division septum initiation protein DivIVA
MAPRTALPRRQAPGPQSPAQPAAEAAAPWTVEGAIGEMSALSSKREKRWFKKSASEQYLYAKSLAPAQRNELEQALEQRFRNPQDPRAGAALDMWLSVQQARLRTHTPAQRRAHRLDQFLQVGAIPDSWRLYHASPERPEYRAAISNFVRIIGDQSVSNAMRLQVAQRLAYHCAKEGTLTEQHAAEMHQAATPEWKQYLSGFIPVDEPHPDLVVGAFAVASAQRLNMHVNAGVNTAPNGSPEQDLVHAIADVNVNEAPISSLEQDLALQRDPLGCEISGWLAAAKQQDLPQPGAFDDEPLARSFARMLARRRPPREDSSPDAAKVLQDGARVIRAIAEDPELRRTVFRMAESALGSCGDNVTEGFSNVVLAVSRHQMVKAVERGEIDAASLNRETRQWFRLAVVEEQVHRFLARVRHRIEEILVANEQAADRARSMEAALTAQEQAAQQAGGPAAAAPTRRLAIGQLQQQILELADGRAQLLFLKNVVTNEPVQSMLYAKVQLAQQLDLPKDIPTTMQYASASLIFQKDLDDIAAAVRASEAEGSALRAFVLGDPAQLWLTAMKELHADELKPIWKKYEEDPVWDEDPHPGEGETFKDWRAGYESRCHAVRERAEAAERELLFRLAGM